jgi:hypothetical protein
MFRLFTRPGRALGSTGTGSSWYLNNDFNLLNAISICRL